MIKLTMASAKKALHDAVATQGPDFVYAPNNKIGPQENCFYTTGAGGVEGSGCLIGVALGILGIYQETLRDMDHVGSAYSVLNRLAREGRIAFSNDDERTHISHMFLRAQGRQDRGASWGEAYGYATNEEWVAQD